MFLFGNRGTRIGRGLFRDGVLVVNMAALGNEEFKVAREIIIMSVVQGRYH